MLKRLVKTALLVCFGSLLLTACISQVPAVDAPKDVIHFPISVAIHPAGRYAAVANANFDRAYKNGFVAIIDLTTYQIVSKWTTPVGSFAGQVAFNHAGTRFYVTARGEFNKQAGLPDGPSDTITSWDVDLDVARAAPGAKPFLKPETRSIKQLAPDPYGLVIDRDDHYLYVTHLSNGELTIMEEEVGRFTSEAEQQAQAAGQSQKRCVPEHLSCPAGVAAGELCGACTSNAECKALSVVVPADGQSTAGELGGKTIEKETSCLANPRQPGQSFCASYCELDRTVYASDGKSVLRIGCPEGYTCQAVAPFQALGERKLAVGANEAAISPATGSVYVTHRDSSVLGVLRPYHQDTVSFAARLEQVSMGDGTDSRGLAFAPDGSRLFVSSRNILTDYTSTPGVLVVDTSVTYEGCTTNEYIGQTMSCERNEAVGRIEVDAEPSGLAYDNGFLYVLLYASDELWIIDSTTREVIERVNLAPEAFVEKPGIFSAHANPYALALYTNGDGLWALVCSFTAHEVAVVQLRDALGKPVNRVMRKIENRAKLYESVYY